LFSTLSAREFPGRPRSFLAANFRQNCWRTDDRWFARDKMKHFSTSMFIFLTDYYYLDKYTNLSEKSVISNSYSVSLTFGIGKEILDFTSDSKYFSIKDLIADIAGIVAGNIIVNNIK
jgi:uncharacterized protein YfiM (DUF2279 family)